MLNYTVLAVLSAGERGGRSLQEKLRGCGYKRSAPSFYQAMDELEAAGFVEHRIEITDVHGTEIRERWYKLTDFGREAYGD